MINFAIRLMFFLILASVWSWVAPPDEAASQQRRTSAAQSAGSALPSGKTASLRIGEGVNFSTGQVTRRAAEVDLALKYMPPQSPHGSRYNVITGQIEYQARVSTTQNYPLLEGARTASFDARPDTAQLTVGDINGWTEDEYNIAPGRFLLVRGKVDGRHYLLKILKFAAPTNNPETWQIAFAYEPVEIALGAPKTAGKNLSLSGVLTYRENIFTKKIIELNLATGGVAEKFDGFGVSRNQRGEYAYIDQAGRIVIADAGGQEMLAVKAPFSAEKSYGRGGPTEVVLSPDGELLAVQVERSQPVRAAGMTLQGYAFPTVVVIDRSGRELAEFYKKQGAAWTPDRRLVVAETVDSGLYVSDREFQKLESIFSAPAMKHMTDAAVSPDGRTVAFRSNNRVWLIGIDGRNFRQLTESGLGEVTPVWSPDGQLVAVQQIDPSAITSDTYRIAVVRLSDNRLTIVTDQHGWTREPAGRMSWWNPAP